MKKQRPIALVCAGPVSRTALLRLPALADQLGWVKSGTISAASRVVNSMGYGKPVREFGDLEGADILLVHVPDGALQAILADLGSCDLDWKGRTVVLFDSSHDSSMLTPLERKGALPATANWLGPSPERYLIEGHPEALRRLRPVLRQRNAQVVQLRRGAKAEYLSAVQLATTAFFPQISAVIDQFRRAGIEKSAAERTAVSLFEGSIRAYFRAGKRLLNAPAKRGA